MQPLGRWDRRKERRAVKQFPPSESHSAPCTGEWGLTPARQWHKHRQTKDLTSEQVRILENPNLQKQTHSDIWLSNDENGERRLKTIQLWTPCQLLLFCKKEGKNWLNHFTNFYKDSEKKQLMESRCRRWMDTETAPHPSSPVRKKDLTLLATPQRRQQKRFAKDARRWHHVKSIRDQEEMFNYLRSANPTPRNGVNYGAICVK